jgi:hypothetical protein
VEVSFLERAVIDATLSGEHPILAALRRQWATAAVIERKFTGVGIYLTIEVAPNVPTVPIQRVLFGDVIVDLPTKTDAMGSLVYVVDGRLTCLEMYTFDMPWPEDVSGFVLKHMKEPRSFETLDAAVQA